MTLALAGLLALAVLCWLPRWFILGLIIPSLMVVSIAEEQALIPPLASIGTADIRIIDALVAIVLARIVVVGLAKRRVPRVHPAHAALAGYVGVLEILTTLHYFLFGNEAFEGQLVSLARFGIQLIAGCAMTAAVRTARDLMWARRCLDLFGYLLVGSLAIEVAAIFLGLPVPIPTKPSELEASERFFGLIGDQVSFVFVFYILRHLLAGHLLRLGLFIAALSATGTRGALVTLAVGLVVIALQRETWRSFSRMKFAYGMVLSLSVVLTLTVMGLGQGLQRFENLITREESFDTIDQRIMTTEVALRVIADNLLLGVGYMGFPHVADAYGAEQVFETHYNPVFIATVPDQLLQAVTDGGLFGLLALVVALAILLRTFSQAAHSMPGDLGVFLRAGYGWLWALVLGNRSAAWILPASMISFLLLLILALAIQGMRLQRCGVKP
jgi:O-Antigen ligase